MQGFLLIHSDSLLDSEQTFSMGIWMYLVFRYLYINLLSCSCLKPNTVKEPNNFSDDYIMSQLKYTGIMETTRIRQCGFPTRLTFEDFLKRWALSSTLGKTIIRIKVVAYIYSSTCGWHWVMAGGVFECPHIYFIHPITSFCVHLVIQQAYVVLT